MKALRAITYLFVLTFGLTLSACSDKSDNTESGPITIHFDNIVGTTDLQMNTAGTPYTNSKGESYNVTWLTYCVSNIKLKKADGTVFEDVVKPDGSAGYYLVDETDAESQDVTLENVPAGDYTEVTFTIGVDANQVNQGAQTGPLDPAKGLFWSWNSGYIFLAMEGTSPQSAAADHTFQFHVGGYKVDAASNQVNNIKTITLSFNGDAAPVRAQHEPEVHLLFDVNKFLNGAGEQVTFTANTARHSPMACQNIAGNITGAFVVDHVHAN